MRIICDTREKYPWDFIFHDVSITRASLPFGDYTSEKLNGILAIERKATPSEVAINLGQKKDKERFFAELEKLKEIKHAYIVCEFSEQDVYRFPHGLPPSVKKKIRLTGRGLMRIIKDAEAKFGIPFLFLNNKAEAENFVYKLISDLEKKL